MGYDLLIAGDVSPVRLRAALAGIFGVPVDDVDVADEDAGERNWQAAVLCTCAPRGGDITWALDVHATDVAPLQVSVAEAADDLARELRVPVLYDAGGVRPSAYWLAAPDGVRTRARVYDGPDDDGGGALVIDAVERPRPRGARRAGAGAGARGRRGGIRAGAGRRRRDLSRAYPGGAGGVRSWLVVGAGSGSRAVAQPRLRDVDMMGRCADFKSSIGGGWPWLWPPSSPQVLW
ncbi:hypothetical protein [Actinoplanes sp. N902-109]|uniref:hypothetical protein n=1 Tax=Actinoplanes sp. (strain N902-109) TaxID=649831 RepID=UPI0012F9289A|nr:hypothetical protein [Actinoplanes sp. N902-109]